ncbi:hypothetical protein ILUMI_06324 [Ignelater luminosus]|uniref:Uncharacterized protein n=1 Tax=Ignelater luminosus TaxID=2038154 RepID=A0A8K0GFH4_IGNLU|nr:hypothetical protein ILUMI_06324 [Ignelater luminosus]
MKERSTLWIHSQIKACMDAADCQPDFCLDLFEPSGHGRRKRQTGDVIEIVDAHPTAQAMTKKYNDSIHFTKFKENIEYTVLMPSEFYHKTTTLENSCSTFLVIAGVLGCLLFLSAFIMCWLALRLHTALLGGVNGTKNIDQLVGNSGRHYHETGYTGRPTTQ